MADDGQVALDRRGPTLVMTLDRPRRRNAMTLAMAEQLEQALTVLDEDPELRVGILTGAGGFFCAGQDMAEAVAGTFAKTPDRGWFGLVGRPSTKPLIAAVEGFALAGGLEIALACDLLVAAEDARFGVPEVHSGQVAAAGALVRLPLRLPYQVAAEMALTGDAMRAEMLHHHGLITRLTPAGHALAEAEQLANRIHANPPQATRLTLDVLRTTAATVEAAGWAYQNRELSPYGLSRMPEFTEGVTAFLEKRPPRWFSEEAPGR